MSDSNDTNKWILNAVWGLLIALGLLILNGIHGSLRDLNMQIRDLNSQMRDISTEMSTGLSSLDRRVVILEYASRHAGKYEEKSILGGKEKGQ